jgi:hypothetical protein
VEGPEREQRDERRDERVPGRGEGEDQRAQGEDRHPAAPIELHAGDGTEAHRAQREDAQHQTDLGLPPAQIERVERQRRQQEEKRAEAEQGAEPKQSEVTRQ